MLIARERRVDHKVLDKYQQLRKQVAQRPVFSSKPLKQGNYTKLCIMKRQSMTLNS